MKVIPTSFFIFASLMPPAAVERQQTHTELFFLGAERGRESERAQGTRKGSREKCPTIASRRYAVVRGYEERENEAGEQNSLASKGPAVLYLLEQKG